MLIELYGRDFYRVSSGNETYFVDMELYGGRGRCDCPNFRCVKEPSMELMGHRTCKHIDEINERLKRNG